MRLHLRDECEVKLWGIEAQPCQACAFNDAIHDAIERERHEGSMPGDERQRQDKVLQTWLDLDAIQFRNCRRYHKSRTVGALAGITADGGP